MAVASDETTSICNHCDRAIPNSNIDLHYAHCSRNLEKCKVCGDMVPKKHAEEHFLNTHAPMPQFGTKGAVFPQIIDIIYKVACSLCSETMEREILAIHKGENCPQRIVTCEFCEFPLPAIDLAEHQEVCGNRTELCHLCNRYIRLRERYNHESRCTGIAENNVGSSRDVRATEREHGARRRQPPGYSRRRLLFAIAITGIAVLLGSLFFQKKTEPSLVH
ncbi:XIAP-associated factor 1-like isoform X1 [Durio zibethinus]|uniref:XIAP-associated factor 1-like isoform X1 n=1 Tax=Durio zibethinus TaxID=66656 RepID=A0A6P5XIB4_DURZI|nr:XIAP-associated factor 1-like isoform X1 [Durio zibethinus]